MNTLNNGGGKILLQNVKRDDTACLRKKSECEKNNVNKNVTNSTSTYKVVHVVTSTRSGHFWFSLHVIRQKRRHHVKNMRGMTVFPSNSRQIIYSILFFMAQ